MPAPQGHNLAERPVLLKTSVEGIFPLYARAPMRSLHQYWGWTAVVIDGLVGVWGLALAWRGSEPARPFWVGVAIATIAMIGQVGVGVWLIAAEGHEPGDQHVFYGLVIAFVFAFAYIYRLQLSRRPGLFYGLLFLFVMGLGLRAITTLELDF